ncbi:transcription initiation factor TFIIE alpha subunit [Galdieria sulphuraria]|uniref:Transcription initiation factor TFIIE alpha subunit n=1 Tax=Galdieria sulphuraria TaxID=130081 RepID=M2XHC5_GALSU|nr:transcription initiation factor TFIIE alpha subunit [Galdieria sulphuraria]EME29482.1 transcription initiation factor TFIIE alpha subunit [Galdieria sulphuraria]|eukprot:XP_005706002.1 transcription initiation factor TFIIE alpha subunit [Galdieria sulphuraria]
MAQVPKQVEDLVRMIARAFYTDLYIVVLDALVREKYIRQDLLSKKLHVPTKELRKLLLKLQEQKLVQCEVRVQRKPTKNNNSSTEYQRAIKATFWYIDYVHLVDVIKYRVDGMRQKVNEMMAEGLVYQSFQCQKCKEVYSSLDSARLFVPAEGVLRCDNVILRNTLCKGLVEEVEWEGQVATIKELQTRMENELRPILEMVAQTEQEKVPSHPLEGLDADQLGTIISENPDEQPSWDTLREELYNTSQPLSTDKKDVEKEEHSQVKVEIVAAEGGTSQEEVNEQGFQHVPSWFEAKRKWEGSKEESKKSSVLEKDWIVELEDSQQQTDVKSSEQGPLEEYSLAYYRSLIGASDSQTVSQKGNRI